MLLAAGHIEEAATFLSTKKFTPRRGQHDSINGSEAGEGDEDRHDPREVAVEFVGEEHRHSRRVKELVSGSSGVECDICHGVDNRAQRARDGNCPREIPIICYCFRHRMSPSDLEGRPDHTGRARYRIIARQERPTAGAGVPLWRFRDVSALRKPPDLSS